MDQYVVTSFDQDNWAHGLVPWCASLREIARYDGKTLVIDGGLPPAVAARLTSIGFGVVPGRGFAALAAFAEENPGVYAFWEADTYFQDDITEVFGLAADAFMCCPDNRADRAPQDFPFLSCATPQARQGCLDMLLSVVARRKNVFDTGFLAGPARLWRDYGRLAAFSLGAKLLRPGADPDRLLLNLFAHCFRRQVRTADEVWNCLRLQDVAWAYSHFLLEGRRVKSLHAAGNIRSVGDAQPFLFKEKYAGLYQDWHSWLVRGNATTPGGIRRKVGTRFIGKQRPDDAT